ncbi:MAG: N-acetylglucosamine kinase [Anaerolineae bacterium]
MSHPESRYVLGLDGGGSKTECILAREDGLVCGHGQGGGVNRNFVSEAEVERSVADALSGTMRDCPDVQQIDAIVGSMSCDSAALRAFAERYRVNPQRIQWVGEPSSARAASEVAYQRAADVVVIAGTGSLVAGWLADGTQRTVGGAGATIGDEGSAYWIAERALRRLVQSFDGRQPFDSFAHRLCGMLAIPNLSALVNRVYGDGKRPMSRGQIAAVAVHVCQLAQAGEPFAIELFEAAAHELAFQVNTLIRILNLREARRGAPFYVLPYGGVFRCGQPIIEPLQQAVLACAPEARFLPPVWCTVIGSVALALRLIGIDLTQPEIRQQLLNGAKRYQVL